MRLYLVNGMVVKAISKKGLAAIFGGGDIPAETLEIQESDRKKLWVAPQHVVAWTRES
jgi:uncharacterized protein (AIM24 family)